MKTKHPIPEIQKLVLPSDLKGVEPGKLPAKLLVDIKPAGKLHHLAADAYQAMRVAARADGVKIVPTSAGDTYRDFEMQKRGFLSRYSTKVQPGEKPRMFEGKAYYRFTGAPMAVPGTSRHNLGLAVDIANASGKIFEWLCLNAPKFGWSLEVMPQEPWHWFYYVGDKTPQAVLDWKASKVADVA